MACCTRYCAAESQFGQKVAERDLRRYQRRGPDPVTRLLLEELRRQPLREKRLLDIGGGIGVVSAELAADGISAVTLVEASPAYLEVARRELESRYASRPVRFALGDFTLLAETLADTDVTTLDRVVCCYPDAEALLKAAATRTRQCLALSYPRDRWYVHLISAFNNLFRRMRGSSFRSFIHPPQKMASVLESAGLTRIATRGSLVWVAALYHRADVPRG